MIKSLIKKNRILFSCEKKKSLTDGGGHSPPLNVNGQSLIIKKNRIVKMAWTSANTAIVVVHIFFLV